MATDVRQILSQSRTVAVLGAHDEQHRPAFYVPEYLASQGYRILPVNPHLVGRQLFGEPVRATLAELDEPVDLVDIFRRSQWLPNHVADILAMSPPPRWVWFQLGIRNDRVAQTLTAAGIEVVQDRCTLADHKRFAVGPVTA